MEKVSKTIMDLIETQKETIKALETLNDKFRQVDIQLKEFKNNSENINVFKELTSQTSLILDNIKLFEKLTNSLPSDEKLSEMLKQTDFRITTLSEELTKLNKNISKLETRFNNIEKPLSTIFEKLNEENQEEKTESPIEI